MQSTLAYIYSLYDALLVPFGTADFGPKLATGLLFLALIVFLAFLGFALPQAYRLRSRFSKWFVADEGCLPVLTRSPVQLDRGKARFNVIANLLLVSRCND
jgi:hypothetical protein